MTTIPDSIIITINTSIPGSQHIKFTPNMIDPKISKENDVVYFDPLVKLNKDVIAKVPEQFRVVEFFKKHYFNSLINFHGLQKKKTLEEATDAGYVDNNISILLSTLFPEKRVLYINNEPYTIADVQWTKGDWQVDKKELHIPKIDTLKFRNPYTLSKVLNSQTNIGNEQLSKLSPSIAYGSNYVGPQSDLLTPTPVTSLSTSIPTTTPTLNAIMPPPNTNVSTVTASGKITPAITNPAANMPAQSKVTELEPIQRMSPQAMNEINYRVNSLYTKELRVLFGRPTKQGVRGQDLRFYYMVNEIYQHMVFEDKTIVAEIFKNTTSVTPIVEKNKNYKISALGYLENINNLNVYKSVSDGDCYFDALQQAINTYNKTIDNFREKLDEKITYEIGGILYGSGAVSYTHLTLPTSDLV